MAQKIKEMSMEEVIERYGIITPKISMFQSFDKVNMHKNSSRIEQFFEKFYPLDKFLGELTFEDGNPVRVLKYDEMYKVICEYKDLFDKDSYIFEVYTIMMNPNACSDLNGIILNGADPAIHRRAIAPTLRTKSGETNSIDLQMEIKKHLKGIDIITAKHDIKINNETYEAIIATSQCYIGNSKYVIDKNKQAIKRFNEIEKKINLSDLVYYLTPSDFPDICRYPLLGKELYDKVLSMPYKKEQVVQHFDMVSGEEKNVEYETLSSVTNSTGTKASTYSVNNFYKVLKPNLKYMEPDKLLVVALENYYKAIIERGQELKYADVLGLKEFYKKVESLIENKEIVLNRNKAEFPEETSFRYLETQIDELVSSYVNCKRCSKEEIAQIRKDILTGKKDYNSISLLDYAYAMRFNADELFSIVSNNPTALEYYLTNSLIDKQTAKSFIENCEALTPNQVLALYKNQLLGKDEVVGLYQDSKISLECIKVLKDNSEKPEEFEDIVSVQTFVELCTDSERKEEFERYRQLFKFLKIDGKTIEEKNALGMEILESSEELLEEQKMFELYQKGIITCDTLIDLGGMTFEELYANGELKPNDARRLLDKEVQLKDGTRLNIESLVENENSEIESFRKILCKMTDEEKMVAIFSTFSGANYKKLRQQLLSGLSEVESSKHDNKGATTIYRHSEDDVKPEDKGKTSGKGNENVTDPCARWNFMSKLDEDYSQDLLKDGTLVVYLPSQQKYIIEKLFDLNHEPAYGAATYVLPEDVFDKHKLDIIQNGKINRSKLVELKGVNIAKKIVHRGWGKAMCKVFDVNNPNLYTPEQRQELEELALEVEKSKAPREK